MNKKIALWGTGNDAVTCYHRFSEKWDIVCFIDNYSSNDCFMNKKVYGCDEFFQSQYNDCFIVIATSKYADDISLQLEDRGKIIGEDFIPYDLFECNWICYLDLRKRFIERESIRMLRYAKKNRKIAIIYGNCQTNIISKMLSLYEEFSREYLVLLIPPFYEFVDKRLLPLMEESFWQECSLFICQHVLPDNKLDFSLATQYLVHKLPEACKIVYIPNAYFLGYFPQCPLGGDRRNVDTSLHQSGRFPYGDKFVDQMMKEGDSTNEIVDTLLDENFLSVDEVNSIATQSLLELEAREKICDVFISDFLQNHYRERQLFYSPNHPVNEVLNEMTCRILSHLGFRANRRADIEQKVGNGTVGAGMPIYPCVIKGLGLDSYFDVAYANRSLWEFHADVRGFLRKYISVCWGK